MNRYIYPSFQRPAADFTFKPNTRVRVDMSLASNQTFPDRANFRGRIDGEGYASGGSFFVTWDHQGGLSGPWRTEELIHE